MKFIFKTSIALLFVINSLNSQSLSSFSIKNNSIKVIDFKAKQVAKISVTSSNSNIINFKSSSESTFKNNIYCEYQVKSDTLFITDVYPKNLEYGDNKMTSMQEFSLQVELEVPQNLKLIITSNYASIDLKGKYKSVFLNTKTGNCNLNLSNTNANISTYSGDIMLYTENSKIKAETRNGNLKVDDFYYFKNTISIKSINGNISAVNKNKK